MTESTCLSVGVLQLDGRNATPPSRVADARTEIQRATERLSGSDAQHRLLVLPELWATGFFHFDDYARDAGPLDGPVMRTLLTEAARADAWMVGGSVLEQSPSGMHNTTVVVDDACSLVATYRKIHLFGHGSREAQLLVAGDRTTTFDTPFGRVGVMTCYDLRFPEIARSLALRGAQVIVTVAAWPAARIDHWRTLLRARAIENQLWVVAANAAGDDAGVQLGGHSMVIAPDGAVIEEADADACVVATQIDVAVTDEVREALPFRLDNRYDIAIRGRSPVGG